YFDCAADCREKADKRGLAADDPSVGRCVRRCDGKAQHVARTPRCPNMAREVPTAADVSGMDAATLRCHSVASALASRLSSCLADCAELAAFTAEHGSSYDPAVCVDACEQNDTAAVALAEARTGCAIGDAAE